MENSNKTPLKINLLGLFKLETEIAGNFGFGQVLLLFCLILIFFVAVVALLKVYILPVLSAAGLAKTTGWSIAKIAAFVRPRSP